MNKEPFFYQIPSTRRGVIAAVLATTLAAVSIVWGSYVIWDHDPEGVTPTPGVTVSPSPTPSIKPPTQPTTTPKAPNPTIVQVPGKTVVVPGKPVKVPPPTVVVVPPPTVTVPSPAPAPPCLDLRKLLPPSCNLLGLG